MRNIRIIVLCIKTVISIYKKDSPTKIIDFNENNENNNLKRGLSFGNINKLSSGGNKFPTMTGFFPGKVITNRNNDFIFHKIINSFEENKKLTINDFK